MTEQNRTKREIEQENTDLLAQNEALSNSHQELLERVQAMEALIQKQADAGEETEPVVHMYHDPFDSSQNPHEIKEQPEGKWLSWKNPNIRQGNWKGWTPVCYDDEIGQNLERYLNDPPKKLEGIAHQDNYVRRGSDSILCWLPLEWWLARQARREEKALRNESVASGRSNRAIMPGVSTYGEGVEKEQAPPGGFRGQSAPPTPEHPHKRTEMFSQE